MIQKEKIRVLENYLNKEPQNFRDSFKPDLFLFFNEDFSVENPLLKFLSGFDNETEIEEWVDFVASQIVLKFDEKHEQIGDFIGEFIQLNKV